MTDSNNTPKRDAGACTNPDNTSPGIPNAEVPGSPYPGAEPAQKAKTPKRIGRPPGTNEKKILQQAMEILDLKARGVTDEVIKKTMGLRERDYERRLKALRENKLLARQAQGVVQEIVLRLFSMRNKVEKEMDNLKAKDHFHRVKHGALILDTEREILSISKQLGYWPPPIDAPLDAEKTADKIGDTKEQDASGLPPLESLTDEQLQQYADSLISKA